MLMVLGSPVSADDSESLPWGPRLLAAFLDQEEGSRKAVGIDKADAAGALDALEYLLTAVPSGKYILQGVHQEEQEKPVLR